MPDRQSQPSLPPNRWPLNQLAHQWLLQGHQQVNEDSPYVLQLVLRGLQEQVPLPGPGSGFLSDLELAAGRLLNRHLDPAKLTRWFQDNPEGPAQPEQAETLLSQLRQAKTWQEAAQAAMETFYDRLAAENDHYRPAPRTQN